MASSSELTAVHYRNLQLSKLNVFYREAGDSKKPTILLLHGFPTSSHMFRNLIPLLAKEMRVIAPDLPGFGYTESPIDGSFEYTFDNLAKVIEEFVEKLSLTKYFVYVMDYGAPTGFRLMEAHPERVAGLVVQNGNAYAEGLTDAWGNIRKYWKDRTKENANALLPLFSFEFTREQYVAGSKDISKISPDNWYLDYSILQKPGHTQIQLDLFYDYQNNLKRYERFHQVFRKYQFPTLIVWGKNDMFFNETGARAFLKDLPKAELHLLDGGHFVVEEYLHEVAGYMTSFVKSSSTVHSN
jgi:pimeloyl-ACP methyl ester carboxylesterase